MRRPALSSLTTLPLLLLAAPAFAAAQDEPQSAPPITAEDDETVARDNEIVVVARRLLGQVIAPQPPVITLDEEEIASYGVSSISDLIDALAPQTGSGRGRGGGRPVILLNGQRISNFREMRNIPPEAIRRMEVLPEEVALRYGFRPDQRVINFILKDDFASRSIDVEYSMPTRGGFADGEFEASMLTIDGASRLNLNFQARDTSLLTEAERDVIQQPASAPTVADDPDPARFRSLVADSRDLSLTGSWSQGLGEGPRGGSLSLNGSIARNDSRSFSGLDTVLLTSPAGVTALRRLGDPLARDSRTDTLAGGAALNKPLGGWQLSVTADASLADSRTDIDRRAHTQALRDAAAAGTLAVDGPLPALPSAGFDRARSRTLAGNSLATLAGTPFRLPAGEASLTVKGGYSYTGIRSSDTRTVGITRLSRDDLNAGVNLGLPITSRREGVLAAIGDVSLNFSAGIADLSDFGSLKDWSAGLTWAPTEKLGFQASYIVNEAAPSLSDLGAPQIQTFNVPVYDFARGETTLVTVTSGGNRALVREKQRDLKLSANWQLPVLRNSSLLVEYFRNRSNDVTASFPLLTPDIEAAFPGRAVRDAAGRLVAIDRRPVTLAETRSSRLRYGINLSGPIGKPDPNRGRGGEGGGPGMGRRGGGGPGGADGPPTGGGPRMGRGGGRGGPGGGGMGRFMGGGPGGGGGQGRWNLSLFHTVRFSETVLVAPGGPLLELLDGDALSGGGVARHGLELEGGLFHKGFGLRFNGSWNAPTRLRATGAPGTSDLRFGSVYDLDLRAFVNFDQRKKLVEAVPLLKGSRLSLVVENVLDSRQRVTDATGTVPLSYQPDFLDPRGRVIGIDFRKVF